jgi:hypothetical protein
VRQIFALSPTCSGALNSSLARERGACHTHMGTKCDLLSFTVAGFRCVAALEMAPWRQVLAPGILAPGCPVTQRARWTSHDISQAIRCKQDDCIRRSLPSLSRISGGWSEAGGRPGTCLQNVLTKS